MTYYTDLFSPETYEAFSRSSRDVSGFRESQRKSAMRLRPGDRLVCYMTKLSRWVGILEVLENCYEDSTPIFYPTDDPFTIRLKVRTISWLPKEKATPIRESEVWDNLSFTKGTDPSSLGWTGILRRSLNRLPPEDGEFLERLMVRQAEDGATYPVDDDEFRKLVGYRVRREDKTISVIVPPNDEDEQTGEPQQIQAGTEATRMQALLARIGEKMGFKIWLPRHDRSAVLREWDPIDGSLKDTLPLNYDDTTLKTIEQIDVLWLKGRAILRAFEVEHTTAVYSGILRMADLLALQPNMDIKLHIVAPETRKAKVFTEIQRPVFSLLDRAPLSECCTYLSYTSLEELGGHDHLAHLSDSVLDEYAEEAE